jgi:putative phosphoesterase
LRVGVVSDTHGLLRPELLPLLQGVDAILHAGDVGNPEILDALRAIAPVTAIRGNVDVAGPCALLPETEVVEFDGLLVYMIHSRQDLDLNPEAAGMAVVVSGHSHQPSVQVHRGVLFLNPGSCGPRRFSLPVTFALLTVDGGKASAEIVPVL